MNKYWFIIKHQFFDCLRFIGMRDRLRCPSCKAVGSWKPHGGWFDESKESGRRWLCKYCGYFFGIPYNQGYPIIRVAYMDLHLKCWRIADFEEEVVPSDDKYIPQAHIKCDPWRG